jgi:diadenosine tetraphosphate (Ap4A) HIT family hydrolase/glutathione S-transferase
MGTQHFPMGYGFSSAASELPSSSQSTTVNTFTTKATTTTTPPPPRNGILYDVPVSNNGARCRLILYKKGITADEILIQPPSTIGGLQSEAYGALNPLAKMPLFVRNNNDNSNDNDDGSFRNIAESDTIARYLLHEYAHLGPSFLPNDPRSNLIARIHDMYLTTIQGCLYKPKPPFGMYHTRSDAVREFMRQLQIINNLMVQQPPPSSSSSGPYYLCGPNVSLADATLYPTIVFASYMLPKFDGNYTIPDQLQRWCEQISILDPDFATIQREITEGFRIWESNRRWDPILGAGWRDVAPRTLFDGIVSGDIPAAIVPQPDDQVLAFRDIHPVAPAHIVLIPKHRNGLTRLSEASAEHTEILGRLLVAAATIARDESLGFGSNGCRIVINEGQNGGQEVMHLHVHLLGGRQMTWPPG